MGDAEFKVRLESGVALSLCSADSDGILDKLVSTSREEFKTKMIKLSN